MGSLGFYKQSCNKIERIITPDTHISVRENETLHFNCRAGVGSVRLFSDRVPRPVVVRPGRELLLPPYFFLYIDLPPVIPLRGHESPIYDSSNVLIHFSIPAAVYSISRAVRVSTIYIAVVRERSRWRYTHRSVVRDRFRLSTFCVYVQYTCISRCGWWDERREPCNWLTLIPNSRAHRQFRCNATLRLSRYAVVESASRCS